jgi:hypothetical protein
MMHPVFHSNHSEPEQASCVNVRPRSCPMGSQRVKMSGSLSPVVPSPVRGTTKRTAMRASGMQAAYPDTVLDEPNRAAI